MVSRIRVLTVLNWLARGGIEVTLLRCLPLLRDLGIDVDVACLQGAGELDQDYEAKGVRVVRIGKSVNPYTTSRSIARVVQDLQADIVHSRMGYTSGGIALGAKRAGAPCIVSFHSAAPTALYNWRGKLGLHEVRWLWLAIHRCMMER